MMTFRGRLYWRSEDGYEQERVGPLFNARVPDRYPAAILKAADEEDVIAGVQLARERGLKVSVRAGCHSWVAWSLREDALLIDLADMREISLDTSTAIVRVSPAVSGEALTEFLAEYGLMFPGGHCPGVGLGGFLLQGGMGWNCRGLGWACESIEAIDVVTAAGELLRADASQNTELLWAARGAGPGYFGVVTRFHLKTCPFPRALTQSTYIYPLECFDEVMHWAYGLHATLAPCVEFVILGGTFPLPQEVKHAGGPVVLVHGLAFAHNREQAVAALAPLETCPVLDRALVRVVAHPTTFDSEYEEQSRENPPGHRYAVDNVWINAGPDEAVPKLRDFFANLPTKESFSLWYSMAPLRELPDMALAFQSDIFFATYAIWKHEEDDARCQAWVTDQMHRIEPITEGLFLADADLERRSAKFLSGENWKRLEQLRARYDPDLLFPSYLATPGTRLNVNPWIEGA